MNTFVRVKRVGASLLILALLYPGIGALRVDAQTAESLSGVKRVALNWPDTDRSSAAVRDRVLQKLRASKAVEIVLQAAQADAVLQGKATIWVTGRVSLNPRSGSVQQTTYGGYASLEASGRDGQVLWSYLATPRAARWGTITDDLGDQLAREFLEALASLGTGESRAGAGTAGAKSGVATVLTLRGAGSTFAAPMYRKWFESYERMHPGIEIQYAAVGSEDGVRRFLARETDFGATDMPLSEQQLNTPERRVLQMATTVGAVVPIYNVRGLTDELKLTPEVLVGIFLGKIRRWNAPEVRAINRHAQLPDQAIAVIHRLDGSGTTFALTKYFSKVSAEWKSSLGAGTTVPWPVGEGATGNEGVASAVRTTPNSIGYVEFLYALQHELNFASVRNASGEYVKADLASVGAAAKAVEVSEQDGFAGSILNAPGKRAYPIATLTWVLLGAEDRQADRLGALRELLRWMLTSGQKQCEGLGYGPLPPELANRELQVLAAQH